MNKQKQISGAITAVYHARLACLGFARPVRTPVDGEIYFQIGE